MPKPPYCSKQSSSFNLILASESYRKCHVLPGYCFSCVFTSLLVDVLFLSLCETVDSPGSGAEVPGISVDCAVPDGPAAGTDGRVGA